MLKAIALLVLVVANVVVAPAQNTWKELRFGMTTDEVRKQYAAPLQQRAGADNAIILGDPHQTLGGVPATADFYFDKVGKLNLIELVVKDPYATQPNTLGNSFAVIEIVTGKLVEKYGTPTSAEGECGTSISDVVYDEGKSIFTCNKLWKADGETVTLYWSVSMKRLGFLSIDYKPLPSDV
jgi:hypothetical protein